MNWSPKKGHTRVGNPYLKPAEVVPAPPIVTCQEICYINILTCRFVMQSVSLESHHDESQHNTVVAANHETPARH